MFFDSLSSEFVATFSRRSIGKVVRGAALAPLCLIGSVLCGEVKAAELQPSPSGDRSYDVVVAEAGWLLTTSRSGSRHDVQRLAAHPGSPAAQTALRLGDSLLSVVQPGTYRLTLQTSTAGAPPSHPSNGEVGSSFVSARQAHQWARSQANLDIIIDPLAPGCTGTAGLDIIIDPFSPSCEPGPDLDRLRLWIAERLCADGRNVSSSFICAAPINVDTVVNGTLSDSRVLRFELDDWHSLRLELEGAPGHPLQLRLFSGLGQPLSLEDMELWPADTYNLVILDPSARPNVRTGNERGFALRVGTHP